jgi:hypothetical protein
MKSSEAFGRAKLAQPRTPRARTFDVGLLIPTSGTMGLLGPGAYACARLARDMWNERGGVDGREVRLSVIDSGEAATGLDDALRAMLAENAALKAEVSRISLRWEIADHRVSLLWAERDEARREVCFAYGPMAEARAAAKRRGWDCFEEVKP